MIIVGGYNVYPREVEEVLYSHPDVKEAVVIGVPDAESGEAVKGYVVPKRSGVTEEEMMAHCEKHLAKYKRPAEIIFLDEIPKNATGKMLRRALKICCLINVKKAKPVGFAFSLLILCFFFNDSLQRFGIVSR